MCGPVMSEIILDADEMPRRDWSFDEPYVIDSRLVLVEIILGR